MQGIAYAAIVVAFLIGQVVGFRRGARQRRSTAYARGHVDGQLQMKDRVRQQINDNLAKSNFVIRFRDGFDLSAEQLLQFMCYGDTPDSNDATRGVATYTPG